MLLPLSLLCDAKVGGLEWVTLDKILFHVYFLLFIFRAKIDIHNINSNWQQFWRKHQRYIVGLTFKFFKIAINDAD